MRVLVVDDEGAVHAAYRTALDPDPMAASATSLQALGDELFSGSSEPSRTTEPAINATFAQQGLDAVALIEQNSAAGTPFQVAFIDIRMPPGIDGKETARRIRAIDPT